MKKLLLIATLVGGVILTGALISNVAAIDILTEEDFKQEVVKKEYFVKTADNFIILFDTSSSMAEPFKKGSPQTQYDVPKRYLKEPTCDCRIWAIMAVFTNFHLTSLFTRWGHTTGLNLPGR